MATRRLRVHRSCESLTCLLLGFTSTRPPNEAPHSVGEGKCPGCLELQEQGVDGNCCMPVSQLIQHDFCREELELGPLRLVGAALPSDEREMVPRPAGIRMPRAQTHQEPFKICRSQLLASLPESLQVPLSRSAAREEKECRPEA
jgi:hypothetical protein